MTLSPDVLVVGCGIFGVTAAYELRKRGHSVVVLDPGPLPHPRAASTDISKVVRMEYGSDVDYMQMVATSIEGWHRWNDEWRELSQPLYHATGVTMLTRTPLAPGGFEHDSYHHLIACGEKPTRLTPALLQKHYPSWDHNTYVDGFYNPNAGYVESGNVVTQLVAKARESGVSILEGDAVTHLHTESTRVAQVETSRGKLYRPDHVVVCAGAWTQELVPRLKRSLRATGHPIFHIRPSNPERFAPPNFVVFTAEISTSGWYGFPLHPTEGVVKIANHGVGVELHPEEDERVVTAADHAALQEFLELSIPELAGEPVVYSRRCLYSDSRDGHLWIDRHPEFHNLTVGAGGSGHAMKMAPLLGPLIAAKVEGKQERWSEKFRWRELGEDTEGLEEARFYGDET